MITDMVEAARRQNVVLCLENLSEPFDYFIPAFRSVPDLRMTLDIGHAQLMTVENTSFGFINHSFSRIAHIHVHDNRGGMSVKDDLHLPLGEGIVDYPAIFGFLKDKGYASTITMEVKPPVMAQTRIAILRYRIKADLALMRNIDLLVSYRLGPLLPGLWLFCFLP